MAQEGKETPVPLAWTSQGCRETEVLLGSPVPPARLVLREDLADQGVTAYRDCPVRRLFVCIDRLMY